MKRIPVSEASATQLAHYASTQLGIDCQFREGRDKILAKMATVGFNDSEIEVEDDTPPAPTETFVGTSSDAPAGPRKTKRIMIPQSNEPGGKEAVPVGVNGRVARIKRGIPVDVPVEYVEVLQNAQRVVFDKDENGAPINPTLVPTHPFSILSA